MCRWELQARVWFQIGNHFVVISGNISMEISSDLKINNYLEWDR